jgi:protein disulfide isomerase
MHLRAASVALALLALLANGSALAVEEIKSKGAFLDAVESNAILVVKFYAPWCGSCKAFAPKFEAAAAQFVGQGVRFATVDATKAEFGPVATQYNVQGYPTLRVFRDKDMAKKPVNYDGALEADALVEFVHRQLRPPFVVLDTAAGIQAFLNDHATAVVGYYVGGDDADALARAEFAVAARAMERLPFAIVHDPTLMHLTDGRAGTALVLLSTDFGATKRAFDDPAKLRNSHAVETFLHVHTMPLVVPWSEGVAERLFHEGLEYFFFYFHSEPLGEGEVSAAARRVLEPIAAVDRTALAHGTGPGITYVDVNVGTKDGADLAAFFELQQGAAAGGGLLPCYRAVRMSMAGEIQKYATEDCAFEAQAVGAFVRSILSGDRQPVLKSAPPPTGAEQEGRGHHVRILVGSTLLDEVFVRPAKPYVAVKFYAPWCGFCKKVEPAWNALGDLLAVDHAGDVLVAEFDGDANEVPPVADEAFPQVVVNGFPSIQLFFKRKNGSQAAVPYDGDRTLKGIFEFVQGTVAANEGGAPLALSEAARATLEGFVEPGEGGPAGEPGKVDDDDGVDESGVLVLTDETFHAALQEHDFLLLEFFAGWCQHCNALKPEYAKAARILNEEDAGTKTIALAKMDGEKYEAYAKRYNIKGFPTIMLFVGKGSNAGQPRPFEGSRDHRSIVNWVHKNMGPLYQTLKTVEELDALVDGGARSVVVGAFPGGGEGGAAAGVHRAAFVKAAETDTSDSVYVLVEEDGALMERLGAPPYDVPSEEGGAIAHVSGRGKGSDPVVEHLAMGSVRSYANVLLFASVHRLDMVTLWEDSKADELFAGLQSDFLFGFEKAGVPASRSALFVAMEAAAPTFRTNNFHKPYAFVFVENTAVNQDLLEFFEVGADTPLPTYRAVNLGTTEDSEVEKFPFPTSSNAVSKEAVEAYLNDVLGGALKKPVKSERAPVVNPPEGSAVTVVVASQWDQLVTDHNVLLEFYAPWCGHCRSLAPTYEKVAQHFEDDDTVTIGKMDATANDVLHKDVKVEGFPTIVMFTNDGRAPTPFNGPRTKDGIVAFVYSQMGNTEL